ncbi:C-GCAxxG-C-C family protein [Bacteroidota bacterium]
MMKKRDEAAVSTFTSGYNCAQSVLSSFEDLLPLERNELLSVSAGFGGGMGKLQKTCGAVTGAFMALSMYASEKKSKPEEAKELANELIREFYARFNDEKGTSSCRDLLGVDMNSEVGQRIASEKDLFGTVCPEAVATATRILEEMIVKRA